MQQLSALGDVIKIAYEGQPDTNCFTDLYKQKLDDVDLSSSVSMYEMGAVGDGVTDDTAAFAACIASGLPIVCGYQKTYRVLGNGWDMDSRSFVLIGNGSTFILDEAAPDDAHFLRVNIPFLDIQTVSAVVANTTYNLTIDGPSEVSSITVEDGTKYPVNTIAKIVSDDIMSGSASGEQMRNGEVFTVGAVVGNVLYTRTPLRYTYTTGIRVGRYDDTKKVNIDVEFKIGPSAPTPTTQYATAIKINGALRPIVSSRCLGWPSHHLDFYGCFQHKTYNLTGKDLLTNQSQNRYGYNIAETGCEGGVHFGITAVNVRHAFTTNGIPASTGNPDLSRYGRSYGSVIIGGTAKDCQSAAWDTHPDAHRVGFIGCLVAGSFKGPVGDPLSVQLRGIGCYAYDITSYAQGGIIMEGGGAGAASKGNTEQCRVRNFTHYPPAGITDTYPYSIVASGSAGTDDQVTNFDIDGYTVVLPAGANAPIMRFNYATGTIKNLNIVANLANNDMNILQTNNATIKVRGARIDISSSTGTGASLFRTFSSNDLLDVDGLEIVSGSVSWTSLVDFNSTSSFATFRNTRWDNAPSNSNIFVNGTTATFNLSYAELPPVPFIGNQLLDHFIGFSISAENWLTSLGTDDTCAAGIQATTQRGAARLTFGNDAAVSMAANGAQLSGARVWRPQDGTMLVESRFTLSSNTNVSMFIGFMDTTALTMPFTLGVGDVVTANTTDAVGIIYDTAADTDVVWGVGVKAGVVATAINLGNQPTSGGQVRWTVRVDKNGNASFFRNGISVGSLLSNAVTASVVLSPVACGFARNTTSKYLQLDYINVKQNVPS